MLATPPKATMGLPFSTGPAARSSPLLVLTSAEDAVVERFVGPGQDFDLAEAAVGRGIDRGGDHVMDRGQGLRRGAADSSGGGITLGTIGRLASAMWVTGSSWPASDLEDGDRNRVVSQD